jgi:hypothetical protein
MMRAWRLVRRALPALALILGVAWLVLRSPVVLWPERGADWIRRDSATLLKIQPYNPRAVTFRRRFLLPGPVEGAVLAVRAMNTASVRLDGAVLAAPEAVPMGSRCAYGLGHLGAGPHEVRQEVRAAGCHPSVVAHCASLGLGTDTTWEASVDGATWTPAMLCRAPRPPEVSAAFLSPLRALASLSPCLLGIFLLAALLSLLHARGRLAFPRASVCRWAILGAWGLLALGNLFRLPSDMGMDAIAHLEYMCNLAITRRVPLAPEGWQAFQPPLYYLASLPLLAVAKAVHAPWGLDLLRILPLLCGMAQVEITYRIMAALFPGRDGIQAAGTALGGLLPMNIYMSQAIGNEPLAAVLTSLAILLVVQRQAHGRSLLDLRFGLLLGTVLGLGLLAKTTVILALPALAGACLLAGGPLRPRIRASAAFLGVLTGVLSTVAGWYYLRNWVYLGRPFVGGWDHARGIDWWQDPGRIPISHLWALGTAFTHPIYAQTAGFWNGLWTTLWLDGSLSGNSIAAQRPPWNYGFILSCTLLALVPSALMVWGTLRRRREPAVLLSLTCLAIFMIAIAHLYLGANPAYCALKATYMLGLAPCFAILGASGLDALPRSSALRALTHGGLACWLASAYLGYLVV